MAERITPDTFEWDLYYAEHAQRYEFFASFCEGRRVLDAACGVGFGAEILLRRGASSVVGVDLSEEAVSLARARYGASGRLQFRMGNCEALGELGEKFDAVVSFETIEHLPHPGLLVEGALKVLNPGGLFICSTPNILRHSLAPGNLFVNQYHLSEMHYADFTSLVGRHFHIQSEFFQDESPAYLRNRELTQTVYALQNSIFWRLESAFRKVLGKELMPAAGHFGNLQRSVPGDYLIAPLDSATPQPKTYIIVAKAP